jgi:hypothetical protein
VTTQWQVRRNRLNHDWLKNRLMPAVATFLNIVRGLVGDDEFECGFPALLEMEWTSHRRELFDLLCEFAGAESPRNLFLRTPLARCDESTRAWLVDLTHHLWTSRGFVTQRVADATDHANAADEAYRRLRSHLLLGGAFRSSTTETLVSEFYSCCQQLADSLSAFPRQVHY